MRVTPPCVIFSSLVWIVCLRPRPIVPYPGGTSICCRLGELPALHPVLIRRKQEVTLAGDAFVCSAVLARRHHCGSSHCEHRLYRRDVPSPLPRLGPALATPRPLLVGLASGVMLTGTPSTPVGITSRPHGPTDCLSESREDLGLGGTHEQLTEEETDWGDYICSNQQVPFGTRRCTPPFGGARTLETVY